MQDDFRGFRRFPTVEKKIGDITMEDSRVSFIGTLVDKEEGKIAVDDGSGSIEILFEEEIIKNFKTGNVVRIIGKVSEGLVNGEAIQDFSKFNIDLYKEVKKGGGKSI